MSVFFPTSLMARLAALILFILLVLGGFRLWLSAHDAALLKGYVLLSEKTAAEGRIWRPQSRQKRRALSEFRGPYHRSEAPWRKFQRRNWLERQRLAFGNYLAPPHPEGRLLG